MERDIRRSNMIPGSCEEFTRPEEIAALSKYLKQVREEYDSNLTVNEDNLEVHGRKFIGDQEKLPDLMEVLSPRGNEVSSLVSSKEWLDNDKSLKGLEQKRHNLSGTNNELNELTKEKKTIQDNKRPNRLENSSERLVGNTKKDVALGTKSEGLKGNSKVSSSINGTKEKIGGDKKEISHLEEEKEKIRRLNKLLGGLENSTVGLKKESREEILENIVEKLFNGKTVSLEEKVESIQDNRNLEELRSRNNALIQGVNKEESLRPSESRLGGIEEISSLENALSTLETGDKPITLEKTKEKLGGSTESADLKPNIDKLQGRGTEINRLEESTEKVKGQKDEPRYLEKNKESLIDKRLPLTELGKDKERIKDWRENEIEQEKLDLPGYSNSVKNLEEHQETIRGEKTDIKTLSDENDTLPGINPKLSDLRPEKETVKNQREPIEVLEKTSETLKTRDSKVDSLEETILKVVGEKETETLKPSTETLSLPKNKLTLKESNEKLEGAEEVRSLSESKEELKGNKEVESLGGELKRLYGKHEEPEELRHLVKDRIILERSQVVEELPEEKVNIGKETANPEELSQVREDLKLPRQDNPLELEDRKERIQETREVKSLEDQVETIQDKRKDPEFLSDTVILVGVEDEDKRKSLNGTRKTLKGTDAIKIDALTSKADKLGAQDKVDSLPSEVTEKIRLDTEKEQGLNKGSVSLEVESRTVVKDLLEDKVKLEGIAVNEENKETLPDKKENLGLGEKPALEGLPVGTTSLINNKNPEEITLTNHRENINLIQDDLGLETKVEKLKEAEEEIKLGSSKETLTGTRVVEELNETKEKLSDERKLESLEDYKAGINVGTSRIDNLENHKEELKAETIVGSLENHKETRPGYDEALTELPTTQDRITVQEGPKYLESEKVGIGRKPELTTDLEDYKEKLEGTTEENNLEDHKEKLEVPKENNLENYKETLEDQREINLEEYKEILEDPRENELENYKETLEDNRETELEDHKETIEDSRENILEDYKEKLKDSRENSLEDYKDTLEDARENELENYKETLEDSRDISLEDYQEGLEDRRDNKLEDYQEKLEDNRDTNLEDYREALDDQRENRLEDYKEILEDSRETELEDHKEKLEDTRENELEDYKEKLEDQRETNLEDYKEILEDPRENELEDYQEKLEDQRENKLEDYQEKLEGTQESEELYGDSTKVSVRGIDPEEKLYTEEESVQSIGDSLDETLEDFIEGLTTTDKVGGELRSDYVEGTKIGYEDNSTLHDETTISHIEENENVEALYDTSIQRPGESEDSELHTKEETLDKLTIEEFEELADTVINGNWEDTLEELYDKETLLSKEGDNIIKLGKASVNSIIGALKVDANNDGKISTIEALLSTLYLKLLSKGYIQAGNRIKDDTTKVNQSGTKKTWKSTDGLPTKDQTKKWIEEDNLDKTGKDSLNKTIKEGDNPALLAFSGEETLSLTKDENSVKISGNTHSDNEPDSLEDYLGSLESGDFREVEELKGDETLLNVREDNTEKIGYASVNSIIGSYVVDWNKNEKIDKIEALMSTLYLKLLSKGYIQKDNRIKDDTTKSNQNGTKKTWSEEDGLYDAVLAMGEDSRTSDLVSDVKDYNIDSEGNDPESIIDDGHTTTFDPESGELRKTNSKLSEDNHFTTFNPRRDELREEVEEKLVEDTNEDSEVEALKKEIGEILKTRNDLGLYYNNILKFANSKQLNKGWAKKVQGLISTHLAGPKDISKGRAEEFEKALYKTIIDEDYRDISKLTPAPVPKKLKAELGDEDMMTSYKLPSFNLMGNGCDPTSYLRWVAENTVGKLVHGPARAILMDEALGLLVLARDAGEKLLKINRDRLPGNDLTSQLLGGGLSLGSVAKSAVKAGAKALFGGGGVDMTLPNNRPDGERKEWKELLSDKTQDPTKGKRLSINFKDTYLKGAGFNTTLKDLIGQEQAPGSVEELYSMLRSSPYITNAGKVTSYDYNPLRVQTLDTNQYWEIIFRPFTGVENNWKSYLPAINEINTWNKVYHNVKTAYSSWIPITSFELSKAKLSTKTLGLFDGEISYPVSMEFTNEFRLTIADDQYKSWRTYFERCMDTMIYNSEVHDHAWYAEDYDDNWGAMDLSDREVAEAWDAKGALIKSTKTMLLDKNDYGTLRVGGSKGTSSRGKLTAIDKKYQLVAPYKNVTFRCTIYSMTPQFSTVSKYDLLLVLKDFVEERSGDIDGDPGDLSVNFSIVGECPRDELQKMFLKGSPQDFMQKKTEDVKRKGSDAASIVSSGVNKVIGVL